MSTKSLWGSMNPIDPTAGLHLIKHQFQKRYMGAQCQALLEVLDAAIERTRELVPVRDRSYLIEREVGSKATRPEGLLERALFDRWGPHAKDCTPAGTCWDRIVGFQVNLPNRRADHPDWGEIDLIGLGQDALPVVIELKQADADDTPAELLVQAVAYGIVLQTAWPRFRPEWQAAIAKHFGLNPVLPVCLENVQLVCAAPASFWRQWVGDSPRASTVKAETWAAFGRLHQAFFDRGFRAVFASISETNQKEPVVRTINVPPL
jgi:hypothetical protein